MKPVEVIKNLKTEKLFDSEGQAIDFEFGEGLSKHEIDRLEEKYSLTLPLEIRELLAECSGIQNCGDVICELGQCK